MEQVKSEIVQVFPWRVVEVSKCEADDIIAVAARKCYPHTPVMIVSSDKDFRQLQTYGNVKQYSPKLKTMIVEQAPDDYRRAMIIKGDDGDGVPNIMSDDDTFVNPAKRQKPMTAKRLNNFLDHPISEAPEDYQKNYERNKKMVDLVEHSIPQQLKNEIELQLLAPPKGDVKLIYTYLASHKMVRLLENAQELI